MAKKIAFNPEIHKARGLKKKENRAFRESGFHPRYLKGKEQGDLDGMVDYILDNFYLELDFEEAENADCVKLATETLSKSYGQGAQETKN